MLKYLENMIRQFFLNLRLKLGGQMKINEAHCIICGEKGDEFLYELAQKVKIILSE